MLGVRSVLFWLWSTTKLTKIKIAAFSAPEMLHCLWFSHNQSTRIAGITSIRISAFAFSNWWCGSREKSSRLDLTMDPEKALHQLNRNLQILMDQANLIVDHSTSSNLRVIEKPNNIAVAVVLQRMVAIRRITPFYLVISEQRFIPCIIAWRAIVGSACSWTCWGGAWTIRCVCVCLVRREDLHWNTLVPKIIDMSPPFIKVKHITLRVCDSNV